MNESSFMLIAPTRRKVHEMRVIYLMERGSNLVWDHVQEEKPSKSGMVRVDITYWMVHGTKEERDAAIHPGLTAGQQGDHPQYRRRTLDR